LKTSDKKILLFGILIALIIAFSAPFLASGNPDGLEGASERVESEEHTDDSADDSPMPDYSIPALGDSKYSGTLALVIGTIITFIIVFGLFYGIMLSKKSSSKSGKDEDKRKG
jgi:cobalt/nickel transport protein